MKKRGKRIISVLLLLLVVILSALQVFKVNAGYGLSVTRVSMGETASLQGYDVVANQAEIYTLDQYFKKYPQVAYFKEREKGLFQYVLVASLQITKLIDDAPPLDLSDFVFRMGNSFNQFNGAEMTELNEWTEQQYLEVGQPFYVKIPYYISESYFNEKQLKNLEKVDYRITWGVYPERYEMYLNEIENWKETKDDIKEPENTVMEDTETSESLAEVDIGNMTGAEAHALLLKEKGLTGDNICGVGESPTVDGVTYEIQSVKQIHNVSEIPDYKEEYQPQPEWMKEGVDVPVYTEEDDHVCKHNYMLVELKLTNVSEKEKAPAMIMTGLAYEPSYFDMPLIWADENEYSTGGAIDYKGSYSDYVVLQPGEAKKVYVLYDLYFNIDPTGENLVTEDGEPTWLITEEEADLTDNLPLYFYVSAGLGGTVEWENKGIVFVELDWRPEDGTEN